MKHALLLAALIAALPAQAFAQATPAAPAAPQAQQAPMPPAGSAPIFRSLAPRCEPDNVCLVDGMTYLYYIETRPSVGSQGNWVPWTPAIAESLRRDFNRLWATNFLDNLWIEVVDSTYPNGVPAKDVIIHMEERQRVKIVDYQGSKRVDSAAIDEKLRAENISLRIDTFIDPSTIRRVAGVVRDLYAEKGYQYAEVKPEIRAVAGGPKLVHLTFHVTEGPKVKIREVDFVGNTAIKDGKLRGKMKENKGQSWLSFVTGGGTYQEAKFADDAELVTGYYLDKGYIKARVGQPQIEIIEDSEDGTTRWVRLRVPVDEGPRFRIGDISVEGNKLVTDEGFVTLFKLKPGDWYSHKKFMKGREKAQEVYGGAGYMEFQAYPDFPELTEAAAAPAAADPAAPATPKPPMPPGTDVTDLVVRVEEGPQYFVNRITFVGNTTTRDSVIRRDLRVYEAGVFNTEGLKQSIRRINQLGYFKPIEGNEGVNIEKAPGTDNKVDVTLRVEEQNRNQLTFGAGVSQFEGFFGNLAFQTANFMGRGETLSISLQQGSRAKNYQIAFSEPYLFDRPITAGIDIFLREIRYIGQFTQASRGMNTVWGFPLANFTRTFIGYSYEDTEVKDVDPFFDPKVLSQYLLLGDEGRRRISKISPSIVHNTVDNPIFANSGKRYSASFDLAGIGGTESFWSTRLEGIQYVPLSRRISLGFRLQGEYIRPYSDTAVINPETGLDGLPIYEKLFLGGEYSVRGFDIRTISPREASGFIIGGNKSLLFNGEFIVNVGGPVRALLFYDAGQVQARGDRLRFPDFKTSTGAEVRFFMPVLNVPFRLIFAYNPQRDGVLDNQLLPQKRFTFKFAVGSTF